jgi:flagellar hook-basal body complex protein FliE
MSTPIVPVEALGDDLVAPPLKQAANPVAGQFGNWFTQELQAVNTQMVQAEKGVQELAAGSATSVHDTMIQLEQAKLSFQLAIQVRTKVLEAYQEIMRMQV